jgi:serine/threonine-protein kinase PRP4
MTYRTAEAQADYDAEPVDEAALIEERRKRREAIKAKYKSSATPMLVQALHLGDKSGQTSSTGTPQREDDAQSTRSGL